MDLIFHPYNIRFAAAALLTVFLAPVSGCSSTPSGPGDNSGQLGAPIVAADAGSPSDDAGLFDDEAEASSSIPSPAPLPVDAAPTCASDADCGAQQFCQVSACGDATGTCVARPTGNDCLAQVGTSAAGERVCGCDHLDYASACFAAANGVSVLGVGECTLPSGPCTSQSDCGGTSYAAATFCEPTTCGEAAGSCAHIPGACPEILDPVCGCDGRSYLNDCYSRFHRVGVAYGGPCRSTAVTTCNTSADCGGDASCVPDPSCAGESCTGTCLAASGDGCGLDESGDTFYECGGVNVPKTQACAAAVFGDGLGATCIFTTGAPCSAAEGCPSGQLCIPAIVPPGEAPASYCVVP